MPLMELPNGRKDPQNNKKIVILSFFKIATKHIKEQKIWKKIDLTHNRNQSSSTFLGKFMCFYFLGQKPHNKQFSIFSIIIELFMFLCFFIPKNEKYFENVLLQAKTLDSPHEKWVMNPIFYGFPVLLNTLLSPKSQMCNQRKRIIPFYD